MARVSCSLTEPTASKPNEGTLKIQVDFSSVAAPRFTDRGVRSGQEEENVEINRILERCLKVNGSLN